MPEALREDVLEPALPIVDPHHHLWDRRAPAPNSDHPFEQVRALAPRYLLDQILADITDGHNVRQTVFIECTAMYRQGGREAMQTLGEVEFVNGIAAMSASGVYGEPRVCNGIVGHVDLMLGDGAHEVLEAHIKAGGGRYRGIRHSAAWDADPAVLGPLRRREKGVLVNPTFRRGFAQLAPLDLSFEVWMLEPQLDDAIDLARAFPDTKMVIDHCGGPVGMAAYQGQREARFPIWRDKMKALAAQPNVYVKLGGLAMPFPGFPSVLAEPRASSAQLAAEWKPYIETCIDLFGVKRSMFESNFPVDYITADYRTLWNAFKRIAAGYSAEEKAWLFSDAARAFYRLGEV